MYECGSTEAPGLRSERGRRRLGPERRGTGGGDARDFGGHSQRPRPSTCPLGTRATVDRMGRKGHVSTSGRYRGGRRREGPGKGTLGTSEGTAHAALGVHLEELGPRRAAANGTERPTFQSRVASRSRKTEEHERDGCTGFRRTRPKQHTASTRQSVTPAGTEEAVVPGLRCPPAGNAQVGRGECDTAGGARDFEAHSQRTLGRSQCGPRADLTPAWFARGTTRVRI